MIAGGGCDANLRPLAHLWIIDYTQVLLIRDDKTAMQVAVQCQWFRYGAVKIHGKNLEILTAQSGTRLSKSCSLLLGICKGLTVP